MNKLAAIAIILGVGLTVPAHATVWTFTSGTASQLPNNPTTFTSTTGGVTITATGYDNGATATTAPVATKLYQNSSGIGVSGGTGPNEITDASFVELNLTNIGIGSIVTLSITGAGTSDPYLVYQSTSATPNLNPNNGTPSPNFTAIAGQGTGDTSSSFVFTRTTADQYIAIEVPTSAGSSASVEISGLTAVPEPGYYAVLSLGMAGLGIVAFRRRQRQMGQPVVEPSIEV
jgi:hypothetical protein